MPFPEDKDDVDDQNNGGNDNDDRTLGKPEDAEGDKGGSDEKQFTQADLDRLLQKRLKRQEEALAKKYSDYDTIKEKADKFTALEDEKSTDAQRWEKEKAQFLAAMQEKDEKLTKLERTTLISDLAVDKGLPKNFWKRVSGDSPEEIEEDIDSIIADLGLNKDKDDNSKDTSKAPAKRGKLYGGGGENEKPDPDTDSIVAKIPRGPQFRIDNSRK